MTRGRNEAPDDCAGRISGARGGAVFQKGKKSAKCGLRGKEETVTGGAVGRAILLYVVFVAAGRVSEID